jgi:hypothetical protein
MSHISIIISMKVLPVDGAAVPASDQSSMDVVVTFNPHHSLTDAQIGNAVERITKRLTKLADD